MKNLSGTLIIIIIILITHRNKVSLEGGEEKDERRGEEVGRKGGGRISKC